MEHRTVQSLTGLVFHEPLSEPTLKAGRQLIAAASLALLIAVYNASVPSLAGGELPKTAEAAALSST